MNATNNSKASRASALVLALVIVGAAVVLPPQVVGESPPGCGGFTPNPCVITIEPSAITAGKTQQATTRLLKIENAYDQDVVRLDFSVPCLDVVPPPAVTKCAKRIDWVAGYSEAHVWDVHVDNTKFPEVDNLLRFDATHERYYIRNAGSLVDPEKPKTLEVTIAFNVVGNPSIAVNPVPITVVAHFANGDISIAETLNLYIDTDRPSVLPGGVMTLDRTGPDGQPNGHIDAVLATFNKRLDEKTFNVNEFEVRGYTIKDAYFTDPAPSGKDYVVAGLPVYQPYTWYGTCPALAVPEISGCSQIMFELVESPDYDTGVLPEFRGSSVSLADFAGNKLANVQSTLLGVVDGAPPRLISAMAVNADDNPDTYEDIRVRFSEPVRFSNSSSTCVLNCVTQFPVRIDSFDYTDNGAPASAPPDQKRDAGNQATGSGGIILDGTLTQPPAYRDFEDDRMWVDIRLDIPLREYDLSHPTEGADMIACGRSNPVASHVRDMGNGGDLYTNVVSDPQPRPLWPEDPDPVDDPGLGLMCPQDSTGPKPIVRTTMVRADTNIWATWAEVEFSVPVSGVEPEEALSNKPVAEIPIQLGSLDVITTNGGGPQGIVGIIHEPCTRFAKVLFQSDQKILPTDVDLTPTKIRSVPDRIRACSTGVDDTNMLFDKPQYLPEMEVPLQDVIKPYPLWAETIDQDNNGVVDGFFIKWSEPVKDHSYCSENPVCETNNGIFLLDRHGERFNDTSEANQAYGPFTYDTDKIVDDDESIIKWDESIIASTAPLIREGRGPDHPDAIHSGVVPHLRIKEAMITDLVPRQGPFNELVPNLNDDLYTDVALIPERDGAPPVIWKAQTVDKEVNLLTSAPDCQFFGPRRCDADPDGMLDGYRITFSEKVNDFGSFDKAQWKVKNYTVTGFEVENRVGDVFFDEVMYLTFAERPELEGDTDAKPQLTYNSVKGSNPEGFRDLSGNIMLDVEEISVVEEDDARPAIWAIRGFEGADEVTILFSEPVDDAVGKPVVRADLTYLNNNGGGVTGFAISDRFEPELGRDPNEVLHTPATRAAIVPLNGVLSSGDVSQDRIAALTNSIRETAPTVVQKKFVLNTPKALRFAPDLDPPCIIQDLRADRTTANSVRLVWTAPDEDCILNDPSRGGTVDHYIFKVNTTAFETWENPALDDHELQGDLEITIGAQGNNAIAAPGETQVATIVGLDPTTLYYVHVRAVDEAGNIAPIVSTDDPNRADSGVGTGGGSAGEKCPSPPLLGVCMETGKDITAPVGDLLITSESHKDGVPTTDTQARFEWSGLTDPESTIIYHYALNRESDYQVVRGDAQTSTTDLDISIPGDGDWYFHVRGSSGGGFAPATATYHVVIGAVALKEDSLLSCDQEATAALSVVRKGGLNHLNWTLPACADNLGTLAAVWIWRVDDGKSFYLPLDVLEGTYTDLRSFSYIDPDGDPRLSRSGYALQLEFAGGLDVTAEGQRAADPTLDRYDPVVPVNKDPGAVPAWIWVLLGIALALIIAGLVIFFFLRGMDKAEAASTAAGYQWEEIGGGPSGVDDASGLPIHDIQCPSCATRFQAIGDTPLEVTCPNCRISGTLD